MIGAGVLVLALVIFGPMILDGDIPHSGTASLPAQPGEDDVRTQTFRLDQPPPSPPADVESVDVAPQRPERSTAAPPVVVVEQKPQISPPKPAEPAEHVVREEPPVPPSAAVPQAVTPPPEPPTAVTKAPSEKPGASQKTGVSGSAAAGGRWLVQVGAFGQKVNAQRLVTKLRAAGFEAAIGPVASADGTLYGVRVGPVRSPDEAAALARRLAAAGYPGRVVSQ